MLKNKILLSFCIVLACCGKYRADDMVVADPKSKTISRLVNIARDSTQFSLEKRKDFLVRAETEAHTVENDTVRLDHLSLISLAYKKIEDSLGFRQMNKKVLRLAEMNHLHKAIGESHWDLAAFLRVSGGMDSAYFYYKKAFRSFERLPSDSTSLSIKGRVLNSMGFTQNHFMDYLGAEISITESLRVFNNLKDHRRIYDSYNLLGIIAGGQKNTEKALEYYNKAGSYLKNVKGFYEKGLLWENQNNTANALLKGKQYIKAETAFRELLKDKNLELRDPELYSKALVSLASINLSNKTNYSEAKNLLEKAMTINDSIGFAEDQARAKQFNSELLAAKNDTLNARVEAKQSLRIAMQASINHRHLEVLKLLTTLDSDNAVAYSNEYYALNEKVNAEERAIRDKFARIRLETDEVIEQNEQLARQKQIWIGAALGLVVLGIAFLIIVTQRISNNRLKFQQKQQESNQEIYNLMLSQQGKFEEGKQLEKKRVSEELHDGVLGQMLGIRLILSGLNDKEDEASIAHRSELLGKLQEVEEEIRTISHELSHASYQKFHNFIVSIKELINTTSESSGIECSFIYDEDVEWDSLVGDIKINAYRIVQESLQNCIKHARCQEVDIAFSAKEGILTMVIADNGVGFDTNKGKRGIGLRNVVSRVKKLGGTLDFDSAKGKGTTVTVGLPTQYVKLGSLTDIAEYRQTLNV